MASGNGTTKWVVGLALTVILAVVGWALTGVFAAKAGAQAKIDRDVQYLKDYAVSNDKRITRLETQYESIQSGIDELKSMLRGHVN